MGTVCCITLGIFKRLILTIYPEFVMAFGQKGVCSFHSLQHSCVLQTVKRTAALRTNRFPSRAIAVFNWNQLYDW